MDMDLKDSEAKKAKELAIEADRKLAREQEEKARAMARDAKEKETIKTDGNSQNY